MRSRDPWKTWTCVLTVLSVSAAFVLGVTSDSARRVGPEESLQSVVNEAAPGTVLLLRPGVYAGPVSVTKSLTIRADGSGEVVIAGAGEGLSVIEVSASSSIKVSLEGLLIETNAPCGIRVRGDSRVDARSTSVASVKYVT